MLHEYLLAERENILALCAKKLSLVSTPKSSSDEMELGLPIFYNELIEVLRADEETSPAIVDKVIGTIHRDSAIRRGKESLRLGYTVSQIVHGYGALCQSITEYATTHGGVSIQAREFNRLNYCLDVAIADAVTEFSKGQRDAIAQEEVLRLGFLAHEMRNALGNAVMAHQFMKNGLAGFKGSTSQVLEDALTRMQRIIDRSLSEVRMEEITSVVHMKYRLIDIIGEVEGTAMLEADAKSIRMLVEVAPDLIIEVDHHLIISAISNLVQNAIKFTKPHGTVFVRGRSVANRVFIDVEDQCGGLPPGKIEELFNPFKQSGANRTGLGLGLSISRRAMDLNRGNISARDIPGTGCIFTIELPLGSSEIGIDPIQTIN